MKSENKLYYESHNYVIKTDPVNGKKYVDIETVRDDTLNTSDGNSKTGKGVGNFNFPVKYTCCNCECKIDALCYALDGCYNFASNQATYSENLAFYRSVDSDTFIETMVNDIIENKWELFRYFTCGDIADLRFFRCMIEIARRLPDVTFWSYTKKYGIVNFYVSEHGLDSIPENLTIIFSHWRNKDGSYFPMQNPYNFPTSEFIPIGEEHLTETVTHICPCSDPTVLAECKNCENPCYKLKHGESMALLEHSTSDSRERDKEVRAAKEALKEAEKEAKKAARKVKKTA